MSRLHLYIFERKFLLCCRKINYTFDSTIVGKQDHQVLRIISKVGSQCEMLKKEDLYDYLKSSQICALPQSAAQMIELSKDPGNGPQEYAKPISADLGLSTQVLRFVNSSFFGFRHKITSIPMALSLASVRTIRNFVLWNGLFAVLPDPQCGPFSVKKLFHDALRRAVFARTVTECFTKLDSDEAFTCALLQDMAIPILARNWGNDYADMIQKSNTMQVRLSILERDRMGWNHSDAGAILAQGWGLGDHVSNAVSVHADALFQKDHDNKPLTTTEITALSALLPKVPDRHWFEILVFINGFRQLFGGQLSKLGEILHETDEKCERLTSLINLGPTPKTLSDYWQEILNGFVPLETADSAALDEMLGQYFTQMTHATES